MQQGKGVLKDSNSRNCGHQGHNFNTSMNIQKEKKKPNVTHSQQNKVRNKQQKKIPEKSRTVEVSMYEGLFYHWLVWTLQGDLIFFAAARKEKLICVLSESCDSCAITELQEMVLKEKACYSAKVAAKSEALTILQSVLHHSLETLLLITPSGKAGILLLRHWQNVCALILKYFCH